MERNRRTHPAAVRVLSRKRCDFPPDGARRLYYSGLDSKRQRIYTSGVEEAHSSLSSPSPKHQREIKGGDRRGINFNLVPELVLSSHPVMNHQSKNKNRFIFRLR